MRGPAPPRTRLRIRREPRARGGLWRLALVALAVALGPASPAALADDPAWIVFVDPSRAGAESFLPVAEMVAKTKGASVEPFDASEAASILPACRRLRPRFAVFVLPAATIDVDLAHDVLAAAVAVDEDPFVDFEYAFVTGRDAEAAMRFARRALAAGDRAGSKRVGMFGSWEGAIGPVSAPMSYFGALGFEAAARYVKTRDDEATRARDARDGLRAMAGRDLLLFFSHGYPDEMAACFRAEDLRRWKVDLSDAVLVNCACWNGAPGRWWAPGPAGPVDRGVVAPEESIALAILDTGVSAYVAGIDPWHGPLAFQVASRIADDGMRMGEAAKRMFDRLALEFLPERVRFPRTAGNRERFSGEGTANRRHNGAGMILYGDPSFAPFARHAPRTEFREVEEDEAGRLRIRLGAKPFVEEGPPGEDFVVAMNRFLDYYSVRTERVVEEASLECYEVVDLPPGWEVAPVFEKVTARAGSLELAPGTPQAVVEETPDGRRLQIRVPLGLRFMPPLLAPLRIAREGFTIELVGRKP